MTAQSNDEGFILLYGSQTGQAQGIAEDLARDAEAAGMPARLFCLDQFKKFDLRKERVAVFVCSTTGEGDAPDNASRFWRQIKKRDLPADHFANLQYTVLGLGDTNYTNFCQMGKNLSTRFAELGAHPFYPPGFADDGTGLELVVEPWREGLIPALREMMNVQPTEKTAQTAPTSSSSPDAGTKPAEQASEAKAPSLNDYIFPNGKKLDDIKAARFRDSGLAVSFSETAAVEPASTLAMSYGESAFVPAKLAGVRLHTTEKAVRRTLEVAFRLPAGSYASQYLPGDAFSIPCPNRKEEVEELLEAMGLLAVADHAMTVKPGKGARQSAVVPDHLKFARSLREAMTISCNIRFMPKKATVRAMAEHATEVPDRAGLLWMSSLDGTKEYNALRSQGVTLLDVLRKFPSCRPSADVILDALLPLQPRSYSACTAATADHSRVHFAFNVVDNAYEGTDKAPVPGLCTMFLEERCMALLNDTGVDAFVSGQWHWFDGECESGPDEVDSLAAALATQTLKEGEVTPPSPMAQRMELMRQALADPSAPVPILRRPPQGFSPPADVSKPLVMVGPGTGVAPFIGFLQHRTILAKQGGVLGETWLIHGCRHREHDFLFRDEVAAFEGDLVLTRCYVASSRDGHPHRYVQHYLEHHGEEFARLMMDEGGYFYVCGNATTMQGEIDNAVDNILKKVRNLTLPQCVALRKEWQEAKRFCRELWS